MNPEPAHSDVDVVAKPDAQAQAPSRWSEIRYVLGLFFASKALIVFVALVAPLLFRPGNFFKGRATEIGWQAYVTRWDAVWYAGIARGGYDFHADGTGSVAFFPLFPLMLRGLAACGVSLPAAGLLVSNLCFLIALWLFYRLVLSEIGRRATAQHATALLAFSPGLAWFSIGYTESLFLMLTLGLVLALRRKLFVLAVGLGVLAGLSRPNAVVLLVPLLVLIGPFLLEAWRQRSWRRLLAAFAGAVSPVVGHAIYLAYLQVAFGNWRANHVVELKGWSAQIQFSWLVFQQKIPTVGLHLFDNPEAFWEHVSWSWFLVIFVTLFSLVVLWEKRARWWLAVFVVCFLGLYSSILQLGAQVYSIGRFAAQIFPFYIALALFAESRPWAQPATLAASVMWGTITGLMLFAGYHLN